MAFAPLPLVAVGDDVIGVTRGRSGVKRANEKAHGWTAPWAEAIGILSFRRGDEQLIDFFLCHLFLPIRGVDHPRGSARGYPHEVVAKLEHFFHLRMAFDDEEVRIAHRFDSDYWPLVVEAFVDPDTAEFEAIAPGDAPQRRLLHPALGLQIGHLAG